MHVKLWGNTYWPAWLALLLVTFLPAEIYGLATGGKNTLSEWVWRTLKVTADESFWKFSATDYLVFGTWIVLVSWLTLHFFLHKFT